MTLYGIYREPGAQAHRRRERDQRWFGVMLPTPQPKRAAVIEAETQRAALEAFVAAERIRSSHVGDARYEWRGRAGRRWRKDDGADNAEREWCVAVTITNGRNSHEARYVAWSKS